MQTFRLKLRSGKYSQPLSCIESLKLAGAVKSLVGHEPEIVPNTKTLNRLLAKQDLAALSMAVEEWAHAPLPAIPETRPGGFMGLLWGFWDWLVGSRAGY